jgi:hypothetical protein
VRRARLSRAIAPAIAALVFVPALACRHLPADPDGRPSGAQPLALGATQNDSLDCDQGDCADWYLVDVPAKGTLVLDLNADAATNPDVDLDLILYDIKGTSIGSEKTGGRSSIELRSEAAPASYYVAVGFAAESKSAGVQIPYTLTARDEIPAPPKPPPPKPPPTKPGKVPAKPTFETKRGSVLETSDEGRSVLLDIGKSQGIEVGQKGRLLRGGAAAGTLKIVEVYPEGSLANITGGKADANCTAEIDVPLAPAER